MAMSNKSEQFRSKGLNIVKNRHLESMTDFLDGLPGDEGNAEKIVQSGPEHKNGDSAALYNKVGPPLFNEKQNENLGRLHIQIRQDLLEKLLDTVFERKRNQRNRAASQRAVIEEALEFFFKNET